MRKESSTVLPLLDPRTLFQAGRACTSILHLTLPCRSSSQHNTPKCITDTRSERTSRQREGQGHEHDSEEGQDEVEGHAARLVVCHARHVGRRLVDTSVMLEVKERL
jgi:hypothetical protein